MSSPPPTGNPEPDDQSLKHALHGLARSPLGRRSDGRRFRRELDRQRKRLIRLYADLDSLLSGRRYASRGEEWLLDNRHVIEDALAGVRRDLPKAYVQSLPAVDTEGETARPSVQALAAILVEQGGQPVDPAWMERAIEAFQSERSLRIGELWALPAFVILAETMQLIDTGEALIEQVRAGHEEESRLVERIASGVISLRTLAAHDWRESFERLSVVERLLRDDPAAAYADMDFESRDRYRRVIEELARGSRHDEAGIVGRCLSLARASAADSRHAHVGYWLVGGGRSQTEREIGYRPRPGRRLLELSRRRPGGVYFLLVFALAGITLALPAAYLGHHQAGASLSAALLVLLLVPALGLAVTLANGLLTRLVPPRTLARLDFEAGIPPACRSAVAVPVIFAGPEDVDHAFERLEINFLANDDPQLVWVVLGDLRDADEPVLETDRAILRRGRQHIEGLKRQYPEADFLFLCRSREFNEREACWMGRERKRGKLMAFNRLLAGHQDSGFTDNFGEQARLDGVRYVITLDADTRLPPGAARQMVGTLAHPLSRAVYADDGRSLKAGYGIIQPRVEIDPDTTRNNAFTRAFSGDTTVDLYTHASSDVYQDLFGEGIFAGKGIYDWRAIEATLAGRIPDNSLLSHDLLEGIFARVGLATDIVLMEQFPPSVIAWTRRQHRWVRGDWQLLPWLGRRVRGNDGKRHRNRLSLVHRWMIVDNLRRSLQPPVTLLLILLAFSGILPGSDLLWSLLFLLLPAAGLMSELLGSTSHLLAAPRAAFLRLRPALHGLRLQAQHWLLSLVLLPYQSLMIGDAVARTLARLFVTHRHLLEWTTAAHVHRSLGQARQSLWRELWPCPLLGAAVLAGVGLSQPALLLVAAPVALAWLAAPAIVKRVERPRRREIERPDPEAVRLLRRVARRTWLFFDHFVGPDTHWLPPDNYQDDPKVVLAARTSPTNMGMALNSAVVAHDFGWIDPHTLTAWLRNSMEGMAQLERYRGHWFNWYEIHDLERLSPAYVSTVDSGNLAVALVTVARALEEIGNRPLALTRLARGLADTLDLIECTARPLAAQAPPDHALAKWLDRVHAQYRKALAGDAAECRQLLDSWHEHQLDELAESIIELAEDESLDVSADVIVELRTWLTQLIGQVRQARRAIESLQPWLPDLPTLRGLAEESDCRALTRLADLLETGWCPNAHGRHSRRAMRLMNEAREAGAGLPAALAERIERRLEQAREANRQLAEDCADLARLAERWVDEMDFGFLYDGERHQFRIGFDADNAVLDSGCYDLLASEARLTSLLAISRGQVPMRHWLHLGRPFRRYGGRRLLMSWGATLFEYLMPRLYCPTPVTGLLETASINAIDLHRDFAEAHGAMPWGVSESAYYQLNEERHYAYRSFGVPGLGFRRDLGERLVVAPYASMMALPYRPSAVVDNLKKLSAMHAIGLFGCYEAVDFGRRTSDKPRRARVVRAWMSHHQGMILTAIDNYLNEDIMVRRFMADRHVAGVSMLLHERLPRTSPELAIRMRLEPERTLAVAASPMDWTVDPWAAPSARYCLLSNGSFCTILDACGGGGSWWQGIAVDRWQPDVTTRRHGARVYVAEPDEDRLFTIAADPALRDEADEAQVVQAPHRVEFRRRKHALLCRLDVAIAGQHDVEARRLVINNESGVPRRLVIASFAELAMAPARDFERHPAFARLFVESECLPAEHTLIFRRRPRSDEEMSLYVGHALVPPPGAAARFGWETDRAKFIGRGGNLRRPLGLSKGLDRLSGTTGAVINPSSTTAVEVTIEPYGRLEIGLLTAAARSHDELLGAMSRYRSPSRISWLFEQARMQSALELHHLQMPPGEVPFAMQLMSAMLEPQPEWRHSGERTDEPLQSLLWSRGISGDWPIITGLLSNRGNLEQIERLVRAHTFISGRQLRSDLLLIDEMAGGYEQTGRDRLQELVESVRSRTQRVLLGQVTVIPGRELSADQRRALLAAASVVLDLDRPDLHGQLQVAKPARLPPLVPSRDERDADGIIAPLARPDDLVCDNGIGGFSADGREYIMHFEPGQHTPAPWSNVLSNPDFGTLVTESGSSFTWAGNSSEYRLTAWPDDPVTDPSGEVIYLRDEETGRVWTPTPGPRPGPGASRVHHGLGYSRFVRHDSGLEQVLDIHVDTADPVKICRLSLVNRCDWTRRVTATCYLEWVLGNRRGDTALHLDCDLDLERHALLASNRYDRFAGKGHAFVASDLPVHGFTTDRSEFLGQGGSLDQPAALWRIGLSGSLAAGSDPCAALQVHLDLPPGEERIVHFVIGHGATRESALALAERYIAPAQNEHSRKRSRQRWRRLLSGVEVETPDTTFNLLYNHWLPYQAITSRLWGRTGYYQSSGGFGFRDQLQDVMAMTWLAPEAARTQILRAASRQFPEGDVLHWWHESPLRGVRTRCSDDLLWLPFVTAQYVEATGDRDILDEPVAWLDGAPLAAGEVERYAEFGQSERRASLFDHCCRAIDRASIVGPHGLPVIGSGDWNDGLNRVSTTGRGESVWLAWFLVRVLEDFARICDAREQAESAGQFRQLAQLLLGRIEKHAWDGRWYLRAWFDDGTPLGSEDNEECRIDLIAQAWSVLGPVSPPDRAATAMTSALEQLVDDDARLIKLLRPPFNRIQHDPGYIRGYPPGIRENGAQYTHAATWALWAAARLGWSDQVERLLGILDPIKRSASESEARHYRLEPYVLAGDVYSQGDNRGRGGWSWYTGAAAWAWRGAIESVFGLKRQGKRLLIDPCLPPGWDRCRVTIQAGASPYVIEYRQSAGAERKVRIEVDDRKIEGQMIDFLDDGDAHHVIVNVQRA
ncbi:GH36-type glycosyl hydrolase domain-containing protein [Wenzhouxiangella sediminis]|uniref:Cellobiose phosphorylase n=1 Tax=Wenzhouxiangella sediminis TaxID=1792836 RepID=A0A3E1K9M0_9GAMM|nr:glucoamylase family protein [Wenzhouxiangella sediminis]RFF30935.1 cellobiose phosphorylase [Wenzhouxiangella sediminis]